jgi:hypothetical protein
MEKNKKSKREIKKRLDYLRGEIEEARISYGEIVELRSYIKHIDKDDVLLLEWAGVKERPECPQGGDESRDCEGCVYAGEYYFNKKTKECELR